jgi:hypothetical protein
VRNPPAPSVGKLGCSFNCDLPSAKCENITCNQIAYHGLIPIPPVVPTMMPTIIIVIVVGAIIVPARVVIIFRIIIPSIIGSVIPRSTAKGDTEALRFRIVLAYRQQS